MEKNVFKILACMALIVALAPNKASATTFDDDETVVFDGIHYMLNDNDKTAETHWAIFPLIRTGGGAPKRARSLFPGGYLYCLYVYYPSFEEEEEPVNYENLGALVVPEKVGAYTVTIIGEYAFNHSGITSVKIGKNVTTIGECAFIWNEKLATIEWPEALTWIGSWAFCHCNEITSVTVPNSVKKMGIGCFSDCENLTEFSTGSGVDEIGLLTLEACGKLTTVNIGPSVKKIGEAAFYGCDALREINIDPANPHFTFTDGALVDNDQKMIVHFTKGKSTLRIPNGIEEIQDCLLYFRDDVKCLVIPPSVSKFGWRSVAYCPNLTSIHSMAKVPPVLAPNDYVFLDVAEHCTLNVPVGSLELYKEAPVWKDFKEIVENPATGVDDIEASSAAADNNVYSLDGRIVKQNATNLDDLGEGIYIFQGKKHFIKK